jgi:hypothetical protein
MQADEILADIAKLIDEARGKFVEFNMSNPVGPPADSVVYILGRRNDAAQAIETAAGRIADLMDHAEKQSASEGDTDT